MINPLQSLHGACTAYLVDLLVCLLKQLSFDIDMQCRCSSAPLLALGIAQGVEVSGMSHFMNLVWHAPARLY